MSSLLQAAKMYLRQTPPTMQRATLSLFVICVGLLLGCGKPAWRSGHGDAGNYILQHAIAYGGRPVSTNGLPALRGKWQYAEDEYGICVLFPAARYAEVESFHTAAFGPKPRNPGWGAGDIGAAIFLINDGHHYQCWSASAQSDGEKMNSNDSGNDFAYVQAANRQEETGNGLCPVAAVLRLHPTPSELATSWPGCPRVARASQPWAGGGNPFGIRAGQALGSPGRDGGSRSPGARGWTLGRNATGTEWSRSLAR